MSSAHFGRLVVRYSKSKHSDALMMAAEEGKKTRHETMAVMISINRGQATDVEHLGYICYGISVAL